MMHLSESTLVRLKTQHVTLSFFLDGTPQSILKKRIFPEKWSVQENLAHLGRYQEVFIERIHRVLEEDTPHFSRYQAETDPLTHRWADFTSHQIISRIKEAREEIIEEVMSFSLAELSRKGVHPKLGSMPIPWWIEFFLLHEAHHLYTIFWILRETENH